MKTKLCIYSQSNYLSRTAIEAEILFAVCLIKKQALTGGTSLSRENKYSKKIQAESPPDGQTLTSVSMFDLRDL